MFLIFCHNTYMKGTIINFMQPLASPVLGEMVHTREMNTTVNSRTLQFDWEDKDTLNNERATNC